MRAESACQEVKICKNALSVLSLIYKFYQFQDEEDEEVDTPDDVSEKEKTHLDPSPPIEELISVHIRPHLGKRSDYPYCITPQQVVR